MMKHNNRIFLIALVFVNSSPTLYGLYNAQGGHQGVRQQVASNSEVFTTILDVNFSTVDAQLSAIETQNSAMRSIADGIDSQLEGVGSKIDVGDTSMVSQLDVIESKIDLFSSAATLITTATTISTSGAYCLANNITGGMSITGTSITLDLAGRTISGGTYGITISGDNVTVRNGTIKNATSANILLTGNQCSLQSCDLIGSIVGLQMLNGTRNRVTDCCAMNNTQAGFSLAQSFSNNIVNCQALATTGTRATYGFVAQNGGQNVLQSCMAQGTNSSGFGAVGFGILSEAGDLLSNNNALSTLATANSGYAYGMFINNNTIGLITSKSYGNTVNSVNWSPNGQYLAIGGALAGNQITVYTFNGSLLTTVTVNNYGASVNSVNWSPNGQYLAAGGASTSGVRVYSFNGTSLVLTASQQPSPNGVNSVNWAPDGLHLAIANNNPSVGHGIVEVYGFNGVSLSLTCSKTVASTILGNVNWSPDGQYLAFGGGNASGNRELGVYAFTGTSLVLTCSQIYTVNINAVNWSPNGQYLAVGSVLTGQQLAVYAFNGSVLTPVVIKNEGTSVTSVNWSPDGAYLADGRSLNASVYAFNGTFLSLIFNQSTGNNSRVNFSPNGNYVAIGSNLAGAQVRVTGIFSLFSTSSSCIVENNLVDGTRTSSQSGIGYSVNACTNLFMGNTAYANDIDYWFTTSCTGDNIYSQLDVIESKIDASGAPIISQLSSIESTLGVCCTALDSQIDRLESKLDTADAYIISKLDLPTCAPTSITTTTVISTSGAYCLANNITGGLSITGTSIMLDLSGRTISGGTYGIAISGDDVTVRNGTIKNATNANMLLTGNQCLIESCDLIGSATGMQLNNATRNRIAACCAMNNSSAGFSLAQSFSNAIFGCQVISTSGSGNVYGFTSQNGAQNLFEDCSAQGISSSGAQAVGYGLYADSADTILASKALSVLSSTVGFAQGMFLGMNYSSLTTVTSQHYGTVVYSVNWSTDGRYLAVGGIGGILGNKVQVYVFNGSVLTTVTGQPYGSTVYSVDWSPNGQYLAVGGSSATSGNQLQIYAFNGSVLTTVTGQPYGTTVRSVNWSPNGQYLAVGGITPASGYEIQLFAFNGSALMLTASQDYGTGVYSVDWSSDGRYLAVGGSGPISGNEIQVFAFNGSALTFVTGQPYGDRVYSVNWSSDGRYLLIGGQVIAGNEIQVFGFNGSALTLVTGQEIGASVASVHWSPDGSYVVASGNDLRVYGFNGNVLTPVVTQAYGNAIWSVDWAPNGLYLAAGGNPFTTNNEIRIFGGFNNCSKCILQNNLVSGVHNAATGGVGYLVDACNNLFVGNTAYANDIDNQFTTSCTGDNIYSQLDVIENKLACGTQIITSAGTIASPGIYCLANDISGDTVITATNVVFDLNGHTINATATGITILGSNVTLKNGIIVGGNKAGVWLNGAQNCDLSGITCSGAYYYGFMLSSSANNNNFEHCMAQGVQWAGFYLYQSHYNILNGCAAYRVGNIGFDIDYSDYNMLLQCTVSELLGTYPYYPLSLVLGANTPYQGESYAFLVDKGTGDILDGCIARNLLGWSVTFGVCVYIGAGCSVKNCIISNVQNGTFGSVGLQTRNGGDGHFVINNSVNAVTSYGIAYEAAPPTTNTIFTNNSSIYNGIPWYPTPGFITNPPGPGTVYGINNVPTPG